MAPLPGSSGRSRSRARSRRRARARSRARALSLGLLLALAVSACGEPEVREPFQVHEASISDIHQALADGRTTCRDVVEGYLARIAAYDRSSGLGAITEVNPRALEVADSLDAVLRGAASQSRGAAPQPRGGNPQLEGGNSQLEGGNPLPGSLFCAPILVKDNFDTVDLPTTGGSIALAGSIPPRDAFMVQRLREEGAIVLAKTNMAEWAFSPRQSVSSSYGVTANAYALDRTPAGSSGGTASGVAASFGVAGLGSDTGNSIRGPSSHLALVGIRSTLGLTSRSGVIPLAWDRDVAGPMARTVEDAARLFSVVAGHDPRDPYTLLGQDHVEADYTRFLREDGLVGVRLGVLASHADPERADTAVYRVFRAAIEELRGLGAEVVEGWEIPQMTELMRGGIFCRRFRYDMARYLETLGDAAPIRDVVEVLETGEFGPDAEGGLRSFAAGSADIYPPEDDPPCPEFPEHPGRLALQAAVVEAMDAAGLDGFIFPSWSYPPAPLDRANEEYRGDNSQGLIPAAGLPGITVPMGFTYGNLPAGLQIVARPFQDALLFQYAFAYEQGTRHRRPPEGFPALEDDPS